MSDKSEAEQAIEIANQALQSNRPISATAGRNLLKIVKNDFDQIKQDLLIWCNTERERRQEEYRASVSTETAEGLTQEAIELKKKITKEVEDFSKKVHSAGFTLDYMEIIRGWRSPEVKNNKMSERLSQIYSEVQEQYNSALNLAEREFLKCERMVLLATITGEAELILAAIPSASEVVSRALSDRDTVKELTS